MASLPESLASLSLSTSPEMNSSGEDTVLVKCGVTEEEEAEPCCVCQESCVNPVRLPCSHTFCYLCIKGVAARSSKCALCRQRIPTGYLEDPQSVVDKEQLKQELEETKDEKMTWFYEAKNGGWWVYEQRTSTEIEQAYTENKKSVRLQISGFYYVIDLAGMVQYREDRPNRRRTIKRDVVVKLDCVKGVAGIRTDSIRTDNGKTDQLAIV